MTSEDIKIKYNIGLLTFPISSKASITPLSNFIHILLPLSNHIYLVSGNYAYNLFEMQKNVFSFNITHKESSNGFFRIINYFITQLKISYDVARISKKVDFWIFFIGGDTLVIPMLIAKLFRKKVILTFGGSSINTLSESNDGFFRIAILLSFFNKKLSNVIIVYSSNLINEWKLESFTNKIIVSHRHFLNFEKFKILKKLDERSNKIAYIGRLSEEKGILNFLDAIKILNKEKNDLKFCIIGNGKLMPIIKKYIKENNLNDKVEICGWINHDRLPEYLNEFKLVVVPSHTEGLPNIILESMACGTPVLASSVGSIPTIVKNNRTGFLMENNSPECIAENIKRIFIIQNLNELVLTSLKFVKDEFNYNSVVDKWKNILKELN